MAPHMYNFYCICSTIIHTTTRIRAKLIFCLLWIALHTFFNIITTLDQPPQMIQLFHTSGLASFDVKSMTCLKEMIAKCDSLAVAPRTQQKRHHNIAIVIVSINKTQSSINWRVLLWQIRCKSEIIRIITMFVFLSFYFYLDNEVWFHNTMYEAMLIPDAATATRKQTKALQFV